MAIYTASLSLKDAGFPLLSRWSGRPTMIRNVDVPSLEARAPTEGQTDYFNAVNKPQIIYCENVMPKYGGFTSVAYVTVMSTLLAPAGAQRAFTMRMHDLATGAVIQDVVIAFGTHITAGLSYIEYLTATSHGQVALPVAYPNPTYISAITPGDGAYFLLSNGATTLLYDFGTTAGVPSFSALALTGIAAADLNLCFFACSAGNYFILAKEDGTIYWNNPNSILDFAPSLTTGAGFLIPTMLAGKVTGLQSWGDGFIVHTSAGSIIARYSNNAQVPWVFTALAGSMPISRSVISGKLATTMQINDIIQYAWTASGLQQAAILQGAQGIFPEVGDFLASEMFDSLVADLPVVQMPPAGATSEQVDVGIAKIGTRYLVISYGRNQTYAGAFTSPYFQYALIYDQHLRRWGKLKIDHIEPVYLPGTISGMETLRQLGFLARNGDIVMSYEESTYDSGAGPVGVTHTGVLIIGSISLVRGNHIRANAVELNIGEDSPSIVVKHAVAPDAINYGPMTALTLRSSGTGTATYGCNKIGAFHAFNITGKFNISYFGVELAKAGVR